MIVTDINIYDGAILHQCFAYRYFGKDINSLGDIIAFRAPMQVTEEHMLDQEDLQHRDFINSADAVNFVWEIPNLSALGAVAYQHLLNQHIADILAKHFLHEPVTVQGDDIFVAGKGKCSVSITHVKNNTALGHTGINIVAGKQAPNHAYSTQLTTQQAHAFMQQVIAHFYQLNRCLFVATRKIVTKAF